MNQTEKNLLCAYIYNNYCRLEYNVHQLQSNLRYRRVDVTDCLELQCAIQEFETFKEVTKHIRILLKIDEGGASNDYPEKEYQMPEVKKTSKKYTP